MGLWTFGLVSMGGHISVACSTQLSVPCSTRWHTLAPHTARATRPVAQVWPRVKTTPLLAQTSTIYTQKTKTKKILINLKYIYLTKPRQNKNPKTVHLFTKIPKYRLNKYCTLIKNKNEVLWCSEMILLRNYSKMQKWHIANKGLKF